MNGAVTDVKAHIYMFPVLFLHLSRALLMRPPPQALAENFAAVFLPLALYAPAKLFKCVAYVEQIDGPYFLCHA
jgi:hypothetical protein